MMNEGLLKTRLTRKCLVKMWPAKSPFFSVMLFFILWSSILVDAQVQPSFDCLNASSEIEKIICDDKSVEGGIEGEKIRRLDQAVAKLYKRVRVVSPKVKASQLSWLKARNQCVAQQNTRYCLIEHYSNRIESLLKLLSQYPIKPSGNLCKYVTGLECKNTQVFALPKAESADGSATYTFSHGSNRYVIVLDEKGNLDWDSSYLGPRLHDTRAGIEPKWQAESQYLPQTLTFKGSHRSNCPDCGTKDKVLVKANGQWSPIKLDRLRQALSPVTTSIDEIYMGVNHKGGTVTVKVTFREFKLSESEGYSSIVAEGRLDGAMFVPESFFINVN